MYADLSQTATPQVAQSITLLEANNTVKILSAIDHIVDQSISQATQPLAPTSREGPSSSVSNSSQPVTAKPTPAPLTPSQPGVRQLASNFIRPGSRIYRGAAAQDASQCICQGIRQTSRPAASMPPVSLLLTRLTVLDVAQQKNLPDTELDRDLLAYVGNWARSCGSDRGRVSCFKMGAMALGDKSSFQTAGE